MTSRFTLALTLSAALLAPALVQAQTSKVAKPAAPQFVRKHPVKLVCYPSGPQNHQVWLRNMGLGTIPAGTAVKWRFKEYAKWPYGGTYVFTAPLEVDGHLQVPGVELKGNIGTWDTPFEFGAPFGLGLLEMCKILGITPG